MGIFLVIFKYNWYLFSIRLYPPRIDNSKLLKNESTKRKKIVFIKTKNFLIICVYDLKFHFLSAKE